MQQSRQVRMGKTKLKISHCYPIKIHVAILLMNPYA